MWPSEETHVNVSAWYKIIFHRPRAPLTTRTALLCVSVTPVYRNHDMFFFFSPPCIKGKICRNLRASVQICSLLSHCIIIIIVIMSVAVMDACDAYRLRVFLRARLRLAQSSAGSKPSCLLRPVPLKDRSVVQLLLIVNHWQAVWSVCSHGAAVGQRAAHRRSRTNDGETLWRDWTNYLCTWRKYSSVPKT